MSPKLLHKGSVKDIYEHATGELMFRFSDRYSIFDWGEMPDLIPEKGASLATTGDLLLGYLKKQGINTHYVGRGEGKEDLIVKAVDVPRDNIEIYQKRPSNILIPLEVIYRFGVPKGSSLLKKFPGKYTEGQEFSQPLIDFTTKLERMDRPLTTDEAKLLAGMNGLEWQALLDITGKIAGQLKSVFQDAGLKLWDGKLEFAFDADRQIMLVDSIGMDEIRLTFEGRTLSKELLRQYYLNSSWYQAINIAKEKSPSNFKNYCVQELKEEPAKLSTTVANAMSRVYQIVNQLISNSLLNNNPDSKHKLQHELTEVLAVVAGSS